MQNAEVSGEAASVTAKVAVLVSSCDRFFDAWRPFAAFWRKHWTGDRLPWPVFLVVNRLEVRSGWLTPLAVGADRGWSDNLRLVLERVEADYLLYLQEDYFLTAPPDAARLRRNGGVHGSRSRGFAVPACDATRLRRGAMADCAGRRQGLERDSGGIAVARAVAGGVLAADRIVGGVAGRESAWDFEAQAAERLRPLRAWTVTGGTAAADALPYLSSAVVRGLWTPEARVLCGKRGEDRAGMPGDLCGEQSGLPPTPRAGPVAAAAGAVAATMAAWADGALKAEEGNAVSLTANRRTLMLRV